VASVIVAGARTPFGKFGGAFKDQPAKSLGAHAIRAALERAALKGADVDYVIGQGDALIIRRPQS
jgi:acetyl-CoA C-acetyltransferase